MFSMWLGMADNGQMGDHKVHQILKKQTHVTEAFSKPVHENISTTYKSKIYFQLLLLASKLLYCTSN